MSVLNWGHCTVKYAQSVDGAPSGNWTEIDTPKEDTTILTPTTGTEKTANEEGGAMVDYMPGKTTFELEFDIFVKKGVEAPFDDDDGIVTGEFALRVIPDDEDCVGIQIDRCVIRVEENYSTNDGSILHHVATCLKPASGKTIKRIVAKDMN